MPRIQRVNKPKTKKGKRFLEKRLPKLIEDEKAAMFIRGANANNTVLQVMKDVATLKKPHIIFYNRKNDIKPFEETSSLEFFSQKNDAAHFLFGSHNKKRPNNLVIGRMFDHNALDMFELGVENFIPLSDFKNAKFAVGSKPLLLFSGDAFENDSVYQRLKNLLIDFFHGSSADNVNVKGLDHLILFHENSSKIFFRNYRTIIKTPMATSGLKVEMEEIGPHMDWVLRRNMMTSPEHFKQTCKKPKELKPKKVKNVGEDLFGTTHGRIHMQRQDYKQLQIRRPKALKGNRFPGFSESRKRKMLDSSQVEPIENKKFVAENN